ncbi:transposase [Cupriavidus necator]
MEIKGRGRRRGSKNYAKESRTQVVAETLHPTRSLAEVDRSHGLNANLVSKWRRHQQRAAASASEPAELFLPT